MVRSVFYAVFLVMLLLFGHSENVQKILQPINNDSVLTLI